jgi:hypothetical protein
MKAGKRAVLSIGFGLAIVATGIADVAPTTTVPDKFFDPEHQRSVASQHEDTLATLVGAPGEFKINLIKAGGPAHTIILPDAMAQVNSIEWPSKSRFAVIGMISGSEYMVAVVDAAKAILEDAFFSYDVTLSPNRAFAIFVKDVPSHFVEGTEDRIRMYDFSRPAQNKPINTSYPPTFDVGVPVYPVLTADEEAARPNIGRPDTDAYHIASAFKWSADSAHVVFVMLHGEHELTVVSATSTCEFAIADISSRCGAHCVFVRADDISVLDDGVAFDLKGTGDFVGTNKHVIVRNEDFSPILWP